MNAGDHQELDPHSAGNVLSSTFTAPAASAITRSVFESKAMPASFRLLICRDPGAVLASLKIRDHRGDLLSRIRCERFEVEHCLLGQGVLQIGQCRLRGGAEQAERGLDSTASWMSVRRTICWAWSRTGLPLMWIVASPLKPNQLFFSFA